MEEIWFHIGINKYLLSQSRTLQGMVFVI